jgi:MFS transporter, FLVCR family, MFS-domain-containing protein 7
MRFILAQNALREGPDASPPLNMRRALIFNASFVVSVGSLVFLLRGKQVRKELDEEKQTTAQPVENTIP